jgi:hypothetical protein
MRSPNKNRSRNKSNRNKSVGNVVNRVFESAGPEGKVRGTPQQVIEKYQTLARDATLSGDPVAAENFLQHAEHYVRMLAEANAQIEAQNQQRQEREQAQRAQQEEEAAKAAAAAAAVAAEAGSDGESVEEVAAPSDDAPASDESTLVETPEQTAEPFARARRRSRRSSSAAKAAETEEAPKAEPEAATVVVPDAVEAAPEPAPQDPVAVEETAENT